MHETSKSRLTFSDFPSDLWVLQCPDGKHWCINATLPDLEEIDGLACFESEVQAVRYESSCAMLGGSAKPVPFDTAREIAKSIPRADAILLVKNSKVVDFHYVRRL